MIFIVFYLSWRLSSAVYWYLQIYAPTNIAIRWLKTRHGLKWAVPAALVLTPGYFAAAHALTTWLAHGGPGWLRFLVVLFIWNGMKFAIMGLVSPLVLLHLCLTARRAHTAGD